MAELVINVSNIISPLCYTILRLEPYTVCPFRCVYCYSRWYMKNPTRYPYPRFKAIGMFKEFARRIRRKELKPIPFRLSTLVDPFPPIEQLYRASEKILSIAIDYEYPLIVNTKSIYYRFNSLEKKLTTLLDKKLAVLQISISTLNQSVAEVIEPYAPSPSERLKILRDLGSTGIPLALRLSPFIPFASPTKPEEIENFAYLCRDLGVKHVIIESLRIEQEISRKFFEMLEIGKTEVEVEGYSLREVKGLKPVVRIAQNFREIIYRLYMEMLSKAGVAFATCKEGLFELHTAPDCCGVYMLREGIVRYTLFDIYRYAKETSTTINLPINYALISEICRKYSRLCIENLSEYPKIVSKGLKHHEKKLLKILQNFDILRHVAPSILNIVKKQDKN